jgi:putative protein-disulfide isomerase
MIEGNQFLCDIDDGLCKLPDTKILNSGEGIITLAQKIQVIYFTDPICSSCWGIEPQLRRLKMEYGDHLQINYKMGGLLPNWSTYAGTDVRKPEDVATHWDKAGNYYDMPIDGNIWLEDPLDSSYPTCIAFKAAQLQSELKALTFLRRIKEMVFLEKKNITKWTHLETAAREAGLDALKIKEDMKADAIDAFEADLKLAKQLGIKGFPSLIFTDEQNDNYLLYGFKPYEEFEQAIIKWNPKAVKKPINTNYNHLFNAYPTLTTKEFAVLTHKNKAEAETFLNELYELDRIKRQHSRNGYLWACK